MPLQYQYFSLAYLLCSFGGNNAYLWYFFKQIARRLSLRFTVVLDLNLYFVKSIPIYQIAYFMRPEPLIYS
jgi:hypothetical protein